MGGIQHEYLVEARVQDIAAVHDEADHDGRDDGGQGDVQHLLPLAGSVDGGRLVQLRVDAADGREVEDRTPAHALIDVRHD